MEDYRSLSRRLNLASYTIDRAYGEFDAKDPITYTKLCLMYALDDDTPHSQKEISEDWMIPRSTLNTIIKQWEQSGYVELISIPGKRREMLIRLTETGKAFVQPYLDLIYHAEDTALQITMEHYHFNIVEAMEFYGSALRESFRSAKKENETNI